ncbi:MAG: hypothetical protein V1807_01625 [Patescibacteria group bacterium]
MDLTILRTGGVKSVRVPLKEEVRSMKRSVVNQYYRDVVKALNECEICWSPCPRLDGGRVAGGWYKDGKMTISTNSKKGNIVLFLIHEALHHSYEDVPEYDGKGESIDLLSRNLFCEFSTSQLEALQTFVSPEVLNGKRKKPCSKNHQLKTKKRR